MNLEHILNEIERHRGEFIPSKQDYLEFLFEYSCKIIDLYHGISCEQVLSRFMQYQALRTLNSTKRAYFELDYNYRIYVPPLNAIDNLLTVDIKDGLYLKVLNKIQEDTTKQ